MKSLTRLYQFRFNHPADKLWALISDTPRWAETSGFPKYQSTEVLQADGTIKAFGEIEMIGIKFRWEELPANWVFEHWFEQERLFINGPLLRMSTRAEVQGLGSESQLLITLTLKPRNLFGYLLSRRLIPAFQDTVQKLLDTADRQIKTSQPDLFVNDFKLSASEAERAAMIKNEITQTPYDHGLVSRLIDYITQKQDVDLTTMRPLAIAKRWKVDDRLVVELFLQSVRSGLLESRWDVICPRCRIAKAQVTNMSDMPEGVHCDACNIDYQSDFASNVELSFSPSATIRSIEAGYFCRSGPGATPHIKEQYSLEPGETVSFPLTLEPGDYRLRTLEIGEEVDLTISSEAIPEVFVNQEILAFGDSAPNGQLVLHNRGSSARTLIVEERSWLRDLLTVERVTTMQAFRDLFSEQILRPGDDIKIRNITFVFSDLVASTSLFEAFGDARAFQLVRAHFSMLEDIVRQYNGSIVKTVGDGIHAAFLTPDAALNASIAIQQSMREFNRQMDADDISIRIGINVGSSISITLNGRLDYYGSTVNLAARLQAEGQAGDISMTQSVGEDPAVNKILQSYNPRLLERHLKGVEGSLPILQITP